MTIKINYHIIQRTDIRCDIQDINTRRYYSAQLSGATFRTPTLDDTTAHRYQVRHSGHQHSTKLQRTDIRCDIQNINTRRYIIQRTDIRCDIQDINTRRYYSAQISGATFRTSTLDDPAHIYQVRHSGHQHSTIHHTAHIYQVRHSGHQHSTIQRTDIRCDIQDIITRRYYSPQISGATFRTSTLDDTTAHRYQVRHSGHQNSTILTYIRCDIQDINTRRYSQISGATFRTSTLDDTHRYQVRHSGHQHSTILQRTDIRCYIQDINTRRYSHAYFCFLLLELFIAILRLHLGTKMAIKKKKTSIFKNFSYNIRNLEQWFDISMIIKINKPSKMWAMGPGISYFLFNP
ncbi:hypothetical protein DPMN_021416 [Dreissena polymorpha]|uniref:Uncharacterized protein n=1 Tax=Dreissena polymorpha TaxID=45954 RepID=A0A9D4NKQ6_DREPO|nr:hypothetical protein DPMN_021416 [Dreissena polymorpha]